MSSGHHIDDFMRSRIIGKIEEGRKITDVAREFDIAHSVVSRLWKSFKTTGMCNRRHGVGRVRSTTPAEDRYIVLSAKRNRRTIWRESGTAYRPENIQETDRYPTCSIMVWAGIMINDRTRLHVVANGTMTGQRYIDEVILPHVRLSVVLQVARRNYPPTNKNTLIRALTEEWDKLPQQLLDNVVQKNEWKILSAGVLWGIETEQSITDVALFFGVHHSVISRLWKQFQTTQTVVRRPVGGRPRVTTPVED
ncbi:uncharacterized protein TNCV_4347241 [Trichonephila clavipes]|nr:uncharacterized protein TNCV_4347241 [Trichonephila clavipes]